MLSDDDGHLCQQTHIHSQRVESLSKDHSGNVLLWKKYCEKLFRVGSSSTCCRGNLDWSDSNFLTTEHRLMQRLRIFHLVWTLTHLILPHKEKANKFRTTQLGLSILLRSPLHAIFPIKCITIMKLTVMLWILRVWDHHSVLSPFTIVK